MTEAEYKELREPIIRNNREEADGRDARGDFEEG